MRHAIVAFLGTAALSVASVHVVTAADLPTKAPVYAPVPYYNWTGFYVGGNVGGGWGHTDFTIATAGAPVGAGAVALSGSGSSNKSGFFGGGQIGFNYQFATNWVAGIEADVDLSGISGSSSTCLALATGVGGCSSSSGKLNDFGTVRGRLGYAWNNVLLYGTGGLAWDESSTTFTTTCVAMPGFPCPGVGIPFVSNASSSSSSSLAGRQEPASSGASFRTGRFGSSTSTCSLMGSETTSASPAPSVRRPCLLQKVVTPRRTPASIPCASV